MKNLILTLLFIAFLNNCYSQSLITSSITSKSKINALIPENDFDIEDFLGFKFDKIKAGPIQLSGKNNSLIFDLPGLKTEMGFNGLGSIEADLIIVGIEIKADEDYTYSILKFNGGIYNIAFSVGKPTGSNMITSAMTLNHIPAMPYSLTITNTKSGIEHSLKGETEAWTKSQIPTYGLIAYYPFTGNANDESGNNRNGTVHGAQLIKDRFGNPNNAYFFDGLKDFIDIPEPYSETFTINLWVNVKSLPNPSNPSVWQFTLFDGGENHNSNDGFYIGLVNNTSPSYFSLQNFNSEDGLTKIDWNNNGNGINTNQWYMVTSVISKGSCKLYINGQLRGEKYTHRGAESGSRNWRIGAHDIGIQYTHGIIDEVRIYNRALSQDEITSLLD